MSWGVYLALGEAVGTVALIVAVALAATVAWPPKRR